MGRVEGWLFPVLFFAAGRGAGEELGHQGEGGRSGVPMLETELVACAHGGGQKRRRRAVLRLRKKTSDHPWSEENGQFVAGLVIGGCWDTITPPGSASPVCPVCGYQIQPTGVVLVGPQSLRCPKCQGILPTGQMIAVVGTDVEKQSVVAKNAAQLQSLTGGDSGMGVKAIGSHSGKDFMGIADK
jgi:hypothetical protein